MTPLYYDATVSKPVVRVDMVQGGHAMSVSCTDCTVPGYECHSLIDYSRVVCKCAIPWSTISVWSAKCTRLVCECVIRRLYQGGLWKSLTDYTRVLCECRTLIDYTREVCECVIHWLTIPGWSVNVAYTDSLYLCGLWMCHNLVDYTRVVCECVIHWFTLPGWSVNVSHTDLLYRVGQWKRHTLIDHTKVVCDCFIHWTYQGGLWVCRTRIDCMVPRCITHYLTVRVVANECVSYTE